MSRFINGIRWTFRIQRYSFSSNNNNFRGGYSNSYNDKLQMKSYNWIWRSFDSLRIWDAEEWHGSPSFGQNQFVFRMRTIANAIRSRCSRSRLDEKEKEKNGPERRRSHQRIINSNKRGTFRTKTLIQIILFSMKCSPITFTWLRARAHMSPCSMPVINTHENESNSFARFSPEANMRMPCFVSYRIENFKHKKPYVRAQSREKNEN